MAAHKHLTLSERLEIEGYLKSRYSFKAIARELNRDCTTIAKEVKNHIIYKRKGSYGRAFNNCLLRFDCGYSKLCNDPNCKIRFCYFCSECSRYCKDYKEEKCTLLNKPPYVCNGCRSRNKCTLEKAFYEALPSQKEYELVLSESRSGILIDETEAQRLDKFISPLIKKGQSIRHICAVNADAIMHSEKTIYNYVDLNLFHARNIDLPRKVRYRPRKKNANAFKVDRACRVGRTFDDFTAYMNMNPDTHVVEIDTVEGTKGGKVLLTIHFRDQQFMLAFLRDDNTSRSVSWIFEKLYLELGPEIFIQLFPIILTDNGSEFSNPKAIEFDAQGNRRTRIFYCDPSAPYQKPAVENNHGFIRRIVPKGQSFDSFTQSDITLMMNHINSYTRKKLNNQPPLKVFSFLYGSDVLRRLGSTYIQPQDIRLVPELLKKQ